jgi:hypothetical protein
MASRKRSDFGQVGARRAVVKRCRKKTSVAIPSVSVGRGMTGDDAEAGEERGEGLLPASPRSSQHRRRCAVRDASVATAA